MKYQVIFTAEQLELVNNMLAQQVAAARVIIGTQDALEALQEIEPAEVIDIQQEEVASK